jgi:hypothetical protein
VFLRSVRDPALAYDLKALAEAHIEPPTEARDAG